MTTVKKATAKKATSTNLITVKNAYIVFHIDGGIGKNIAGTAVAAAIKKNYPEHKLIIVTSWIEPWYNNTNVYRVFHTSQTVYFYQDYIIGKETKVFMLDPYRTSAFIHKQKSLIEIWCDLFNIEYDGEQPQLYFNAREHEFVRNQIIQNRPVFILQTNGGTLNNPNGISWARDLPLSIAQEVVNHFAQNHLVLHIKQENQPALNNTTSFTPSLREAMLTIAYSQKRLFIDSFAQHAAAALGKPSVVTWVSNLPKVFGYNLHTNVVTDKEYDYDTLRFSYVDDFDITGSIIQCPYKDMNELFDAKHLISEISKQK